MPKDGPFLAEQIEEYRLVRYLGGGAMGRVYLAQDTFLDRSVALKFIAGASPSPAARERFLTEARAIARLHHPNVVTIHRISEYAGEPYLVSEYVVGQTLDAVDKPLDEPKIRVIAIGLAQGLQAAHSFRILHRDIKPANVILTEAGEVKLLDFGLAKLLGNEAAEHRSESKPLAAPLLSMPAEGLLRTRTLAGNTKSTDAPSGDAVMPPGTLTRTGAVLGTPLYMAPEMWRGEAASIQSDIYSLGAVLFELCTGRPPHVAKAEELSRIVTELDAPKTRELAPQISSELAAIIDRCLSRNPEDRPSSAKLLLQALRALPTSSSTPNIPKGNPYRGLRPFEAEHRALFFGRGQDLRNLIQRLKEQPLVLVTGDSGVGKSSLCHAGVLPLVAEGALGSERRFRTAGLTPGRHPVAALAEAVAPLLEVEAVELSLLLQSQPSELVRALRRKMGDTQGLLLFIDQLEELVTQSDATEAVILGELLGHLADHVPGVRVLATVRSDFLTRLAEVTDLSQELSRGLYLLRTLSASDLREAIVGPAGLTGVVFETEELIEEMIQSTVAANGGLPLLQFALAELWESRDVARKVIPASALSRIGGVAGALAAYADGVLERLLPSERMAAQRVLIKLVTLSGTRLTRTKEELLTDDPAEPKVLERLVEVRLLVAHPTERGGTAYEVAHEALLRGWKTLNDWLSAAADRRVVQARLEAAASEWERLGKMRDALWSERQLLEVDKVALDPDDLPPRVLFFLRESRRNARRSQLLRVLAVAGVCLLLAASLIAYWQWLRRKEDEAHQKEVADRQSAEAIIKLSQQTGQEINALVGAIKLYQQHLPGPIPSYVEAAVQAAAMAGGPMFPPMKHDGPVYDVAFSPDAKRLVSASGDGTARVWELSFGKELLRLAPHQGSVRQALYSPDGRWIVTRDDGQAPRIWDVTTGSLTRTLIGHTGKVNTVAFSADSHLLVSASDDADARVWDLQSGQMIRLLHGHQGAVLCASFSPDGKRILTCSVDHTAKVWKAESGQCVMTLSGHSAAVLTASFSPDGRRIVTGSEDTTGRLWSAESGETLATLRQHMTAISHALFIPAGDSILTIAVNDMAALLWDSGTGSGLAFLKGHNEHLLAATISPDSHRIVTASADHSVRLWDGETGESRGSLKGIFSAANQVAFSADSRLLAIANQDDSVLLYDNLDGSELVLAGHQASIWSAKVSPLGTQIATASGDHTVRLSDAQDGHLQRILLGHSGIVTSVSYSPGGEYLVSSSSDHTVRIWEPRSGKCLHILSEHTDAVNDVDFSPDGRSLISVSNDRRACLWEVTTGKLLKCLQGHQDVVCSGRYSSDGQRVVTASRDGTARIWETQSEKTVILKGHHAPLSLAVFSTDGTKVLTGSEDRTARLWNAENGLMIASLERHVDTVIQAGFSPHDDRILTGGMDWNAYLWDARTGQFLTSLNGHTGEILAIAYSPDGGQILTGSSDGTARLWNARNGQNLSILSGHGASITTVSFYPDGHRVLTASTDRTARVYPSTLQSYRALACTKLRRWAKDSEATLACR